MQRPSTKLLKSRKKYEKTNSFAHDYCNRRRAVRDFLFGHIAELSKIVAYLVVASLVIRLIPQAI